ncbi:TetR/AcrR family transcriptional regulator [Streptomyces reniochalinae]|uniref:TetR family transcriptional regulator n=1 Tax=Streptomyces reniochalinae TaxID=2250578 RepID=A0A367EBQ9_9ACTN|nr:TetR/AcrR family transcriptional regulator C-terminal domain-containing protein [Streptomyces reniochalinae]RCG15413.1 TetR family transcriptional regulator [Streptomyces reniochalinae]
MTAAGDNQRTVALLWGEAITPTRGPKPTLSAARIARTAIDIADTEGLAAVSMQRVAASFEYTTMSLYRYVGGKAALVELMVDIALESPPAPDASADWRARLETWAQAGLERYRRHPWLLGAATAEHRVMGPHELSWLEAALDALSGTPLTVPEKHDAFLVINGHVRNVAQELAHSGGDAEWNATMSGILDRHGDRFPTLTAALSSGEHHTVGADSLQFGLACILDGLAAQIARRQR